MQPGALRELPRIGADVDRYRVLAPVAVGGMAAVFAVERTSIGGFEKILALKVILPHLAADRHFVDMFLDEARIASQIQHPNVVRVVDVVEHDGLPCIVMEYLHGRSLSELLRRAEGALALDLRCAVLASVAAGLRGAHAAAGRDGLPLHVVHRDVSPQNVHVGFDGHVAVVDFGIAAARGRLAATRSDQLRGKLEYMAPEQILASETVSSATDVWSFGVMAWQALAGTPLFADASDAATMWNVVHREVVPLSQRAPAVDAEVAEVVMACLRRTPSERTDLATCERVLTTAAGGQSRRSDLARVMNELFALEKARDDAAFERTVQRARAGRGASTSRRIAVGFGVVAAVAGVGTWALLRGPAPTQVEPARDPAGAVATEPVPGLPEEAVPVAVDPRPRDAAAVLPETVTSPPIAPATPAEVEPAPPAAASPPKPQRKRPRPPKPAATGRTPLFSSPYDAGDR